MMLQSGDSPVTFSAETNPFLRQAASGMGSFFGKKMKKADITKILSSLSGMGEDEEQDAEEMSAPSLKPRKASMPKYNPKELYGGFLSLYGGQKVRGGLLGE